MSLPDNSVDVIISNCVINLSGDKDRVLKEAFRVLKPGGRFAVSDIVTRGEVPEQIRKNVLGWAGCIAGRGCQTFSLRLGIELCYCPCDHSLSDGADAEDRDFLPDLFD